MKQTKEIRVTLRLTPEQYDSISARAERAQMPVSSYIRASAMRHKVVVVDGLKEFTHELKGLGRNLNQLVMLCNQGKVDSPNLVPALTVLGNIYAGLQELTAQERR